MRRIHSVFSVICLIGLMTASAFAQTYPVAHWINRLGQRGDTVLSASNTFVTDFKGSNDLIVTPLNLHSVSLYTDSFGGSSSGNNPYYVTNFIGASSNYTGDGGKGDFGNLEMTYDGTGSLQFDFTLGLTPVDRIMIIDIDGSEQYQFSAYTIVSGTTNSVSLAGWTVENFSGSTGTIPNSSWPIWDSLNATLTSGTSGGLLTEELVIFTPDRKIDRFVINKLNGSSYSTDVQFLSPHAPLYIQPQSGNVVISWPLTFTSLKLYNSISLGGPWTLATGAAGTNGNFWTQTNSISGQGRYYRLQWP